MDKKLDAPTAIAQYMLYIHVTMLQVDHIITLCNSIPRVVTDLGFTDTQIHEDALDVCNKFKNLFHKYSKCHHLFNSRETFDSEKFHTFGR